MQTQPCLLSALQYPTWKNQMKKYFVFLLRAPINVQFQRQTFSRKQPIMLTKKQMVIMKLFVQEMGSEQSSTYF